MSRKEKPNKQGKPAIEWLDGFLLIIAIVAFLNIVLALMWNESTLFRILPGWIVLASIILTQRHLSNNKLIIVLLGTLLCYGCHQLMYLKFAQLATGSRIIVSVFLVYIPLLSFFTLLTSTKFDNLQSTKEQLHAVHTRLRGEANDLLNKLHEMRNTSSEKLNKPVDDNDALTGKRATFKYHSDAFKGIMDIRHKRDIPNLIETLFKKTLKIETGVIYEAPENKKGDYKIRNIWGLGGIDDAREKAAIFRNGDITRICADKRHTMSADDLKRQPNLYEAYDNFSKEMFIPEWVLPVSGQDTTLFVVYTGKQKGDIQPRLTAQVVEPLLSCISQAIVKLANSEIRPSFSTFNK